MSLKEELESEQVAHLDLSGYCQTVTGTAVSDALNLMRQNRSNVCLVLDGDQLIGIFTERDIVRKVALHQELLDRPVDEIMTADPFAISCESSAAEALWLMHDKHIRNLPVLAEDGSIAGDMTYRSVIQYLAARYPIEVINRPPQPAQFPRKVEGG